jgi:hypothetical protein
MLYNTMLFKMVLNEKKVKSEHEDFILSTTTQWYESLASQVSQFFSDVSERVTSYFTDENALTLREWCMECACKKYESVLSPHDYWFVCNISDTAEKHTPPCDICPCDTLHYIKAYEEKCSVDDINNEELLDDRDVAELFLQLCSVTPSCAFVFSYLAEPY